MLLPRVVLFAALLSGPASWAAGQQLGLELDTSAGATWPLTDRCRTYGCTSPPTIAFRAGYELLPFASIGLRAAGLFGPTGRAYCPGPNLCGGAYRAWSVLLDGRFHTLSTTQLTFDAAFGISRLISLQCQCEELGETTGSRLPTLEFALGARTHLAAAPVYLGLEVRYSAMFGADSFQLDSFSRRIPQGGLVVSSVAASLILGASL
jgi:hypothetical protein